MAQRDQRCRKTLLLSSEEKKIRVWETKRNGEKKRTRIGGVGEEKGRGVKRTEESLCSGKSCESHIGEKLQVAHGKMGQSRTVRRANPKY